MRVITKPSNALKTQNNTKQFPDPRYVFIFIVSTVLKLWLSTLRMYDKAHTLCAPTQRLLNHTSPGILQPELSRALPGYSWTSVGKEILSSHLCPVSHSDNKQKPSYSVYVHPSSLFVFLCVYACMCRTQVNLGCLLVYEFFNLCVCLCEYMMCVGMPNPLELELQTVVSLLMSWEPRSCSLQSVCAPIC